MRVEGDKLRAPARTEDEGARPLMMKKAAKMMAIASRAKARRRHAGCSPGARAPSSSGSASSSLSGGVVDSGVSGRVRAAASPSSSLSASDGIGSRAAARGDAAAPAWRRGAGLTPRRRRSCCSMIFELDEKLFAGGEICLQALSHLHVCLAL